MKYTIKGGLLLDANGESIRAASDAESYFFEWMNNYKKINSVNIGTHMPPLEMAVYTKTIQENADLLKENAFLREELRGRDVKKNLQKKLEDNEQATQYQNDPEKKKASLTQS